MGTRKRKSRKKTGPNASDVLRSQNGPVRVICEDGKVLGTPRVFIDRHKERFRVTDRQRDELRWKLERRAEWEIANKQPWNPRLYAKQREERMARWMAEWAQKQVDEFDEIFKTFRYD